MIQSLVNFCNFKQFPYPMVFKKVSSMFHDILEGQIISSNWKLYFEIISLNHFGIHLKLFWPFGNQQGHITMSYKKSPLLIVNCTTIWSVGKDSSDSIHYVQCN